MVSFFSDKDQEFRDSVIDALANLDNKVNLILKYLNIFYEKDNKMAYDISALVAAVHNEQTVEASLVALVKGLSQKVASMAAEIMDDATKSQLADLANQLNSNASDMASAVSANTPAPKPVAPTVSDVPASPEAATGTTAAATEATNNATGTTSPAAPAVDSSTTPTANS